MNPFPPEQVGAAGRARHTALVDGNQHATDPDRFTTLHEAADTLLRLPLHGGLTEADIAYVASRVLELAQ
jgi:dTDP-4-amino-4,6-dideoxygalactose transaminase